MQLVVAQDHDSSRRPRRLDIAAHASETGCQAGKFSEQASRRDPCASKRQQEAPASVGRSVIRCNPWNSPNAQTMFLSASQMSVICTCIRVVTSVGSDTYLGVTGWPHDLFLCCFFHCFSDLALVPH